MFGSDFSNLASESTILKLFEIWYKRQNLIFSNMDEFISAYNRFKAAYNKQN